MAAPQRRYRSTLPTQPALPPWERAPQKPRVEKVRRKERGRRGRLAVLVLVPVLLMLGSVYLHTVSGGIESREAALQEELDGARASGERLEVEVAGLSAAERVRSLAREKLGMRDAGSADLQVVGDVKREDGTSDEGEPGGGEPRPR
jgi:cell division protein FtsL